VQRDLHLLYDCGAQPNWARSQLHRLLKKLDRFLLGLLEDVIRILNCLAPDLLVLFQDCLNVLSRKLLYHCSLQSLQMNMARVGLSFSSRRGP